MVCEHPTSTARIGEDLLGVPLILVLQQKVNPMTCKSCFFALVLLSLTGMAASGAEKPINVGMLPDSGGAQDALKQKEPLKAYLTKALGREVDIVILPDYASTVAALGDGRVDFAYLGGLTYLKAHKQYGVVPLVQRSSDTQFHALFITRADSSIRSLNDLRGRKFAFGDVNSTSGHVIPYLELRQAGIDPDKDLTVRYTGNHPATIRAVETRLVDAGAVDESIFQSLLSEGKIEAGAFRIFHVSKPFVDTVWVARKEVSSEDQEKFAKVFIALKQGLNDQVLQILRGKDFVRANNEEYNILRLVAQQLKML
jgi:phosphonate transport system substrate-binding protein